MSEVTTLDKSEWKVKLQNFQSIISGEISIRDGLNIVTGSTNNGKTAFLRAIDRSIFNTGTDDIVRAGTKIAGVTISNGKHTMIYCRNSQGKNEKTAYQFDGGSVQKKVGRAQLPEVIKMFGIREVRMQNGIKVKLNFWNQGEKPFLTDCTSGQLYEFLSLSSCDKYVKVLKQMVVDMKVQEAEINNANVKIDTLKSINNRKQDFIDKNKGFDGIYERTIVASHEADILNANIGSLGSIQSISGEIKDTKDKLISVSEKLDKIDINSVSILYDNVVNLSDEYSDLYKIMCDIKSLSDSLKDVKSKLKNASDKYSKISKEEKLFEKKLKKINELSVYSNSFKVANECESLLSEINNLKTRIISLEDNSIDIDSVELDMKRLNDLDSCYKLWDGILRTIKSLKSSILDVSNSIKSKDKELIDSENELESFKAEVGYCPFCGSVFSECTH